MFSAKIKDVKIWKSCVKAVSSLVDETTMNITAEGLRVRTMDTGQIAMIDVFVPASCFEEYKLDSTMDVGVDFTNIQKVMSRTKTTDALNISIDAQFVVELAGDSKRKYSYGLVSGKTTLPKEPKIDFPAKLVLVADKLKEAFKDADLVSNHIIAKANVDKTFLISAKGDSGDVDIDFNAENVMSAEVKEEAKSTFVLDMLSKMVDSADSDGLISVYLKNNTPIKIEYKIGDAEVKYYLAPRIEAVQ